MKILPTTLWAGCLFALFVFPMGRNAAETKPLRQIRVKEIRLAQDRDPGKLEFSAPVAIASAQGLTYVVDSQECAVSVFSEEGRYQRGFGSRGQGPGEFNSPAGLDVFDGQIYLADRFNRRIQILDKEGRYVQSFKVDLNPEHVCVLARDRIVVAHLPLGWSGKETLIHCFDLEGYVLWQREGSFFSGDRVYDTFRNLAILGRGGPDDCYFIRKCNARRIHRYDKEGHSLESVSPSHEYPFKRLTLPLGGKNKVLESFCWDGRFFRGEFYLLVPERTREGDLGPGRRVLVIGQDGRTSGVIDLPGPVKKIAISDTRIFAIDTENRLRVFGVETK